MQRRIFCVLGNTLHRWLYNTAMKDPFTVHTGDKLAITSDKHSITRVILQSSGNYAATCMWIPWHVVETDLFVTFDILQVQSIICYVAPTFEL